MEQIIQEDKEEIVVAKLIKMEQELREWYWPSLKHLQSLVSIFSGSEHLKVNIFDNSLKESTAVIDQLFKNFLVIDSKKDLLPTLEHWHWYELFLCTLLSWELFQREFKQDVIDTIQNRVHGIHAFIEQARYKGLLPVNNITDYNPNYSFDSLANVYRDSNELEGSVIKNDAAPNAKPKTCVVDTDSESSDYDISTKITIQK